MNITHLKTSKIRLKEEENKALKEALLPFSKNGGKVGEIIGRIFNELDKETVPDKGTTEVFIMIKAEQNDLVVEWILENSKRPLKAVRIWSIFFKYLAPHTGQICLTQKEIAKMVEIHVNDVSAILSELAEFGAIFKRKEGRQVFFYLNPHVGEFGSRATAEKLSTIPKPGAHLALVHG